MPKIVLANFRADYAENVRAASGFPVGTKAGGDTSCRFLWHLSDGDVLVVPDPVGAEHIEYFSRMAGVDGAKIGVVSVNHLLSDAALLEQDFVAHLRSLVGSDADEWSVLPCVFTRGVVELADRLGFPRPQGDGFALENGVDLLNMKSTFRRLAAGSGLPVAPGRVVRSPAELAMAITATIPATGMVIVKQDRSGGGHGNVGLTTMGRVSMPGTKDTRLIRMSDVDVIADDLWSELSDLGSSLLVVESYQDARHRFYLEFELRDERVTFLNGGMIRYSSGPGSDLPSGAPSASPRWSGLDLQLQIGGGTHTEVAAGAWGFLELVRSIGYRGHVNIDGLVTTDRRILFQEINARWGGSLVYHEVANRLLGPGYADAFLVSSVLDPRSIPFAEFVSMIDESGLGFDTVSLTGVVALAGKSDLGGGVECVAIGRGPEEILGVKDRLSRCLASWAGPEGQ